VREELSALTDPATYVVDPDEAWKRVKTRTHSGRFLAIVRELARFREGYAQARNIPRSRVFKDDALMELASTKPKDMSELSRSRLLLREARKGEIAEGILKAVRIGQEVAPEDMPKVDKPGRDKLQVNPALADLLRVLLKARCEQTGVAQKLIASAADLDVLAAGKRDVPALKGWRAEVFGKDALRLCEGHLALGVQGQNVKVIEI
jgi:ribonuclease D